MRIRRAEERGAFDGVPLAGGRLDTRHSFSFGRYHDPEWMGFRSLRVLNEDRLTPGGGFPMHMHRDMEIVSYVLDGALAHRDSLGGGSVIRRGDVQRMSAGLGVEHSEFNASPTEPAHFLQIWIVPARRGMEPSYEQRHVADADRRGVLRLIASADGAEGSLRIGQDARLYAGVLGAGERAACALAPGRHAWVQVARGVMEVNGVALSAGDGAALSEEAEVRLTARGGEAEALVLDLA